MTGLLLVVFGGLLFFIALYSSVRQWHDRYTVETDHWVNQRIKHELSDIQEHRPDNIGGNKYEVKWPERDT
jgi:hypothetical protein